MAFDEQVFKPTDEGIIRAVNTQLSLYDQISVDETSSFRQEQCKCYTILDLKSDIKEGSVVSSQLPMVIHDFLLGVNVVLR